MRVFTTTELARMHATQVAAMQDTCTIQRYTETRDNYNNPSPEYVDAASSTVCGLRLFSPEELLASSRVPQSDGEIRLPLETALDPRDRIQITHRYGVELDTPQVFEIVGFEKRGPSGLVVDVKLAVG